MKATQKLHDIGQSIWLDNLTRGLLVSGTLQNYIQELSVTGLTSNPTIFDHAIKNSHDYDDAIRRKLEDGKSGEALFFELATEDLREAADLFRPIHNRTDGVDGWVSLEVSPLLAHDTAGTLAAAKALHTRAERSNLFIKIPGTSAGLLAIEEAIFVGVPINVTLLFSGTQYVAAAEAYLRGIERRIAAGLNPDVASVASLFVSRWDVAVKDKVPEGLRNRLGIAVAWDAYERYRALLDSSRWQRILNAGARSQRLLWASTGAKDPNASQLLYVQALAKPFTVNTMPEATLKALAAHEEFGEALPRRADEVLAEFAKAGIDTDALSVQKPNAIETWSTEFRQHSEGEFQLNLWIPGPEPVRDYNLETRQRKYLATWGPTVSEDAGDTFMPDFEAQCQAMIAIAPKAISSIMGVYDPAFVSELKAHGILWLATATTVAEARVAEKAGADVIVAQGMEAGGHRGAFQADEAESQMVGLIALLPQIVDAVNVPVIATGGIADARGVAAAMILGASAVQIGTGFLRSPEAMLHPAYADRLEHIEAHETLVTRAFTGRSGRAVRSEYVLASTAQNVPPPAPYPIQRGLTRTMREDAQKAGDVERMQMWAGQAAKLARAEPAGIITQQLWENASRLLS
jgi:transaldolase